MGFLYILSALHLQTSVRGKGHNMQEGEVAVFRFKTTTGQRGPILQPSET